MNAEIIAVGSELLLGQIANTNAQYLSKELAQLGINVFFHTTVGDNPSRLKTGIEQASKRSDLIIFTGGLGPTKDDLTKETIASFLEREIVYDKKALEQIEAYFNKVNRTMSENNKKQATVIQGSNVFPNDAGMAPGMVVEHNEKTYMLFPGPPSELKVMFERYGREYLKQVLGEHEHIESRVLRFFGIGESQLETDIIDLIDQQTNPTIAPLAAKGEVTLRLTAKHASLDYAQSLLDDMELKIKERVGSYFYGYGDSSLSSTLFELLMDNQKTVASAESLTGGLFSDALIQYAGSSDIMKGGVVCYTNEIKQKVLDIDPILIEEAGAVSKECAEQLAENVRKKFGTDIGISFTGVAGPSESEGKPVGKVFIGIARDGKETEVYEYMFAGSRNGVRQRAVMYGCFNLMKLLKV